MPIIDSITGALDGYIDNVSLHPVVRHAALRGLLMLNKYYARTDESIVYRIAMGTLDTSLHIFLLILIGLVLLYPLLVLHPRHKTAYFSRAGWPREWIDEAERITRQEWIQSYKPKSSSSSSIVEMETMDTSDVS